MITISVIVPIYNGEKYLKRCIDSIMNQTFSDFELILINDGSIDSSYSIIKTYKNDNRVLIINQENQGIAKTRNIGINLASGKYITFIDNDDYIEQNYLETLYNQIENAHSDVVYCGYTRSDINNKTIKSVKLVGDYKWNRFIIIAPWAKLYNTRFIKNNCISFLDSNIGEDIFFNLNVIDNTDSFLVSDYVGYHWFYNEESVSNTTHRKSIKDLQFNYMINNVYNSLSNKSNETEYEYFFIKTICWFLMYSIHGSSKKDIKSAVNENFKWLEERYTNFYKNKYKKLISSNGEKFGTRLIIAIILKLYRHGALCWFLNVYSRRKSNGRG